MVRRGSFIGGQDNLSVPDAPTIGAATAGDAQVSVAFTAPSDVGDDPITLYGASATDGTNVIGATNSASPVTITGLTNGTSYTARVWAINDYGNGPLSDATSSFSPVQPVGFFSGGESSGGSRVNSIDKIVISTTANATDFGDLSSTMAGGSAIGGSTRYIVGGGYSGSAYLTTITFKLFSSSGNMSSFGSLTGTSSYWGMGLGNSTRGFIAGGLNGGSGNRVIHYITIASEGNSADFGDLIQDNRSGGGLASSTRGVIGGGDSAGNVIQYITISSLGNASDFGDLTSTRSDGVGAVSSGTRGVFAGGASEDIIDYITIASTGNATDFGDLSTQRTYVTGASSTIRGVFGGGVNQSGSSGRTNIMEYITIASTGNVTDFGDLSVVREAASGASNSHGGLS
jgi:hypothetical protein